MDATIEDDSLLKIQTLETEYANLLSQYKEAQKNYQDMLDSGTDLELTAVKGKSWEGSKDLSEGVAETQEDCEYMCVADKECSGATFNPENKYCRTRSGDGVLKKGAEDDVALVPKLKTNILTLTLLNSRLMDINEQMSNEFKILQPDLDSQSTQKTEKQKELDDIYLVLSEDKQKLQTTLDEYNSISQEYENKTLSVNKENTSYKLWLMLASVTILILFKLTIGGDNFPNAVIIVALICILTIFTLNLNILLLIIVGLLVVLVKVILS
jgi:hypothetical protein